MSHGTGRMQLARSRLQSILIALCGLVAALSSLALPVTLGRAIDAIVTGGDSMRWLGYAGGLIAIAVACDLLDAFVGPAYAAGMTAQLRHQLVRHLLSVSPHRLLGFGTGDLVSRISGNAAEAAQATLSRISVALAVLPPVGSLILLALMDLWLAAGFLAAIGLVVLVLRSFSRHTTTAAAGYQKAQGRIAARLAEALAGARTIAAAGTVAMEQQRVLQPLGELRAHGARMWQVLARSTAQAAIAGPLVLVAVLATGGVLLAMGRLSAGDLFAASRYAVIGAGLGALTGVLGSLARARAARARMTEVTSIPVLEYGEGSTLDGALEFQDVTVDGLLHSVTFTVPAGACVAVTGPSGSGKSVLAALAARLRDPDSGRVLLGGVPLAELTHDALRRAVGCAFEKPKLVGGTVADAISLGRSFVRPPEVAASTYAHDFVARLPCGYDTPIADAPMSGGEAQRLGLARAWGSDRLLVLDDATSSLDMVTELKIGNALLDGEGGRTRLIVTHRVTTAARADLVVWLESGRVRGFGAHDLLWTDPQYRAVFQ